MSQSLEEGSDVFILTPENIEESNKLRKQYCNEF